ncbi:hypothetical protein Tco_1434118, partial [Tanacetum coccineum]
RLDLKNTKTAQAQEISSLKKRFKSLGDQEDASKQGRKIDDIEKDAEIQLGEVEKEVSTADPVTTASVEVSATSTTLVSAATTTTTTGITKVEISLAQALAELKSAKPKAMIDADYQMAQQLQEKEQERLSIKEKLKLFVQLLEKRKKHFAALRAQEKRNKPPTKTQKRNTMSTYLKNMAGYKHTQLKNKSFEEIQMLFDKEMKRVNTFVDMDTELVKGSETRAEYSETRAKGSSKRAGEDLQQESIKKQKVDDDDDKVKEDLKQCFAIVPQEEVAINAIPLATKPAPIVAKHGYKMPEEAYERVLWGDLKVMFEPHIEDAVWMNLQGQKILLWKLYDYCGVHFVRFQNMHIYMLVEKTYYLIPATITEMLNKKLQAEYWNEMCYQLLKLMTKLVKKK